MEPQDAEVEDLRDHLLWQLNLTPMSARDRAIAATIIEAIDDDGYLTEPDEAIQASLASLYAVTPDEIEAVRHRVQRFDPVGVASRTLKECLARAARRARRVHAGARAARARSSTSTSKRSRGRTARACASACTRPRKNSRPRSR